MCRSAVKFHEQLCCDYLYLAMVVCGTSSFLVSLLEGFMFSVHLPFVRALTLGCCGQVVRMLDSLSEELCPFCLLSVSEEIIDPT